jgi:hypothetical protein
LELIRLIEKVEFMFRIKHHWFIRVHPEFVSNNTKTQFKHTHNMSGER